MTTLSDAFRRLGIYKVEIENGGIYRIRDKAIAFPADDASGTRTKHEFRTVVVLSCNDICKDDNEQTVLVAPMSSDTTLKNTYDVKVRKSRENGLNEDGRIIISHIQPILKEAFEKKIGVMPDWDWNVVVAHFVSAIDR